MGYRRKMHAASLCKSIMFSIQWFQIHNIINFSAIYNKVVGLSGARVSPFHGLVPQLLCLNIIFFREVSELVVSIIQARDLTANQYTGSLDTYIRGVLQPDSESRFQTKVQLRSVIDISMQYSEIN